MPLSSKIRLKSTFNPRVLPQAMVNPKTVKNSNFSVVLLITCCHFLSLSSLLLIIISPRVLPQDPNPTPGALPHPREPPVSPMSGGAAVGTSPGSHLMTRTIPPQCHPFTTPRLLGQKMAVYTRAFTRLHADNSDLMTIMADTMGPSVGEGWRAREGLYRVPDSHPLHYLGSQTVNYL